MQFIGGLLSSSRKQRSNHIMPKQAATLSADALHLVPQLLEAGEIDTVYWDLYLHRARALLAPVLPYEEYLHLQREQSQLDSYVRQSRSAIEQGDWKKVKELGDRIRLFRNRSEEKQALLGLAQRTYGGVEAPIDPFSVGLQLRVAKSGGDLAGMRERMIRNLVSLEETDLSWQAFYADRRAFFLQLSLEEPTADHSTPQVDPHHIQREALLALEKGDMGKLEHLVQTMLRPQVTSQAAAPGVRMGAVRDLSRPFSTETLARANRFGLIPARVEPELELSEHLSRHAWSATRPDRQFPGQRGTLLDEQSYPPGTPAALKETLDLFMIHLFINSGGTRYLPRLVAEEVLVENFPEPEEDDEAPASELLSALGLKRRRGLSRVAIEQALLARGSQVIANELALDPHEYRLLCIPPDLYIRLGSAHGWGRQRLWTHFDGYQMLKDGRLRALAGGDARYGGLYDLLGLSRTDERERVIVRFAVVRRARLLPT